MRTLQDSAREAEQTRVRVISAGFLFSCFMELCCGVMKAYNRSCSTTIDLDLDLTSSRPKGGGRKSGPVQVAYAAV